MARGFADRLIPLEGTVSHSHGPGGGHSHEGTAFTTWLDMDLASAQALAVGEALGRLAPEHEAGFRQRLTALEQDLAALDARLQALGRGVGDRPLLFSHPVYQYLIRAYGLNGRSVNWEPNQPPTPAAWRELQELLAEHPASLMIWESEPLAETVRGLKNIGIDSVVFQTCANRPAAGDFISAMAENIASLEAYLSH